MLSNAPLQGKLMTCLSFVKCTLTSLILKILNLPQIKFVSIEFGFVPFHYALVRFMMLDIDDYEVGSWS